MYGAAFTEDPERCVEAVRRALQDGPAAAAGQEQVAELTLGPGPWNRSALDLVRRLLDGAAGAPA